MNKKILAVILSVLLIGVIGFSAFAYYMNKPEIIAARALTNKSTFKLDGNAEIKVSFDTSKLMQNKEFASNPFALIQIGAIKSALEASSLKLSYNGTQGDGKFKFDGNVTLPEMLGKSTSFSIYAEKDGAWFKQDQGAWTKSEYKSAAPTAEESKADKKAVLDFLKSCPVTKSGDTITVTMHPKYEDIKKMISKEELSSINDATKGQLTLEQLFNMLDIQMVLDIKKDSKLFIPNPYVSRANTTIKGDLSKLSSTSVDIPADSKPFIEGISFTVNAEGNFVKNGSAIIERPADIK